MHENYSKTLPPHQSKGKEIIFREVNFKKMSYLNFQIFKETSREKQTCLKENKWLSDQQPLFVILCNELMCLKKTYHSEWRCSEKTPEPIFGTMLAYDSMAGENKASYLPYTYLVGGQLCTYISLSHSIHL